jgi:hypothetical protein
VTQREALDLAADRGVWLRPLGGTGDGVIGALAGVALAAAGEDGRFVDLGEIRSLSGRVAVERLIASGIAEVRGPNGASVSQGWIENAEDARPDIHGGRAVLRVESAGPGLWRVPERRHGGQRPLPFEERTRRVGRLSGGNQG